MANRALHDAGSEGFGSRVRVQRGWHDRFRDPVSVRAVEGRGRPARSVLAVRKDAHRREGSLPASVRQSRDVLARPRCRWACRPPSRELAAKASRPGRPRHPGPIRADGRGLLSREPGVADGISAWSARLVCAGVAADVATPIPPDHPAADPSSRVARSAHRAPDPTIVTRAEMKGAWTLGQSFAGLRAATTMARASAAWTCAVRGAGGGPVSGARARRRSRRFARGYAPAVHRVARRKRQAAARRRPGVAGMPRGRR